MSVVDLANYFKQTTPAFYYFAAYLGAAAIIPYFYTIVAGFIKLLFRKRANLKQRYGEGAWALVTGSSEGIGKEIATQLARQELNILLLSRNESKLKHTQSQLQKEFSSIKVEYVIADLVSEGTKENQEEFLPQLNKYDLSVVVNNAGVYQMGKHKDLSVESIINLIQINCFSLAALNHKYLRIFKDKVKRTGKKCAIINVSSISAEVPLPLASVYSGSKAYVDKLTKNLAEEHPQIDWLVIRPSEVSTAMTCFKNLDLLTITAKQSTVAAINDFVHQLSTNGHITHKIQSFISQIIPPALFYLVWQNVLAPEWLQLHNKFREKLKGSQPNKK